MSREKLVIDEKLLNRSFKVTVAMGFSPAEKLH